MKKEFVLDTVICVEYKKNKHFDYIKTKIQTLLYKAFRFLKGIEKLNQSTFIMNIVNTFIFN